MTGKIGAYKSNALVNWRGFDGEVDRFAGVDADTGTTDRCEDGLLMGFHFLFIPTFGAVSLVGFGQPPSCLQSLVDRFGADFVALRQV